MQALINIDVDDLERGVRFYTEALGLHLVRRLFDGSVVEMLADQTRIYLLEKQSGTSPAPHAAGVREYRRHWTPVHLDFAVEDLDAAVRRAVDAGAQVEGELQIFHWGRLAAMSDPFGHGFCLLQFSGRGYDEPSNHA
jgi:predicted enzyme related to lactoylglutathione lyase